MGYNTETWQISAGSDRIVTQTKDTQYICYNVGKANVTIVIIQGNDLTWFSKPLMTNAIVGGQMCIMNIGKRNAYIGVKVINQSSDVKAYVHVAGMNTGYPQWDKVSPKFFSIDANNLAKTLVTFGAGKIPVVGSVLSTVIGFFWPPTSGPDAWDVVKDKVMSAVNESAQNTIKGLTAGKLAYIKERIEICSREVDDPKIIKTVAAHYMNIAEDLLGFEKQFSFTKESNSDYAKVNYILLPMWSIFINLKLTFYQFGIVNQKKVGLDDEHVERLKNYCKRTVTEPNGAVEYVNQVYKDIMVQEYQDAYAEHLYDTLATCRAYCALNGFENLVNWKAIAENPKEPKRPENTTVVFSTQFGRNNSTQSRRQVTDDIPPPLQPKVVDGKLNVPVQIEFVFNSNDSPRIGGLLITYANGEKAETGIKRTGANRETMDFKNKNIVKLIARGTGQINGLEFYFDDDSSKAVGTQDGDKREFSLDKHRIVGFFMTGAKYVKNDNISANIAVSYSLIPDK